MSRFLALILLRTLSPLLFLLAFLIWIFDGCNPLYISSRIGLHGTPFFLYKFRTMYIGADSTGIDTTTDNDQRVTWIGYYIRKLKLDELPQLYNIFLGDMNFTGPRPNVIREVELYTDLEKKLLSIKPGLSDFASIVFSDLGSLLAESKNPNLDYNQKVRPWKSRLGLLFIDNRSTTLSITVIILTLVSLLHRPFALKQIQQIAKDLGACEKLLEVIPRTTEPEAHPPPGAESIVLNR